MVTHLKVSIFSDTDASAQDCW